MEQIGRCFWDKTGKCCPITNGTECGFGFETKKPVQALKLAEPLTDSTSGTSRQSHLSTSSFQDCPDSGAAQTLFFLPSSYGSEEVLDQRPGIFSFSLYGTDQVFDEKAGNVVFSRS